MRKSLFRHFKFDMFRGLFLSLLGVALLTFGVMSLVMLNLSVRNMREEEGRLLKSKLNTIITDLENQMEAMKEVMSDVSYRREFRWDYIRNSKYNEIVAMKQMKAYVKLNSLWTQCFVKYSDYENILFSNAYITQAKVYLSGLYGKEGAGEVLTLIEELFGSKEKKCVVYSDGMTTLFLLPTVRHSENNQNRIVVGFEIPKSSIKKRIEELVGELNGEFQIEYNGKVIYAGGEETAGKAQMMECISYDDDFLIRYRVSEHGYFSRESIITFDNVTVFVILGLVLMILILVLTFWNYKPVRRLANKYAPTQDGDIQPALDSIDKFIENLLMSKERDSRILQEQSRAMKEYIAYMAVSAINVDILKKYMTLLNIDYEKFIFGVVSCNMPEGAEVPDMDMLITAINDLAIEDKLFYPCYHKEDGLKVLLAVEETYQFEEALELLCSLFEAMNLYIVPKLSARSEDLENWWYLAEEQSVESVKATEPARSKSRQKRTVEQVVEYMEQNYGEYDLSLEVMSTHLSIHPAYLSRIFKQEMGVGYKEYLMELRMSKAEVLLLAPGANVTDVCQKVGYANTSHFIKLFQKHKGMTPARYRDENCDKHIKSRLE